MVHWLRTKHVLIIQILMAAKPLSDQRERRSEKLAEDGKPFKDPN